MKYVSIFLAAIFSLSFLQHDCGNANKANQSSANNQNLTVASASPTSTPTDKSKKQKPSPTPAGSCSPLPTPLSEAEKNDPLREQTLREMLDGGLGSIDVDCDGVCNAADNCVLVYNPNQKDSNKDGYGDACDPKLVDKSFVDLRCDMDGDGVPDNKDNCPGVCNSDQEDVNKNGIGDVCAIRLFRMQF